MSGALKADDENAGQVGAGDCVSWPHFDEAAFRYVGGFAWSAISP